MENLKPIEPGCMALYVGNHAPVHKVKILVKVKAGDIYKGREIFPKTKNAINAGFGWAFESSKASKGWAWAPEDYLIRIDDYDETAQDRLEKSLDRTNDKRIRATSGL